MTAALIYCRISTDRQTTLLAQEDACRAYCGRRGLVVRKVVSEIVTAYSGRHLAEQRIEVPRGVRHVICYDVSRMGRLSDDAAFVREHLARGVQFHFVSENIVSRAADDAGFREVQRRLRLAQHESEQLSNRIRNGKMVKDSKIRSLLALIRGGANDNLVRNYVLRNFNRVVVDSLVGLPEFELCARLNRYRLYCSRRWTPASLRRFCERPAAGAGATELLSASLSELKF
ncbi:ORF066 [Saltwater crocodilepox virus]|nr:site-specific recombinase-like protein [Saltwater crocodilepox virus]AVD69401.1 site-specific recombinase-like protein [Saltwater crocodilepox virus]QGT46505.1 ORF066 [Saltwater crocodilepox virus]QGT46721.1 ORF066 [Saltwater crocodilepox virus]QGT46938.1 ORF066 [Saltwater crocodilepox virus]